MKKLVLIHNNMYIKDMSHGGENVENKRRIW